MIFVKKVSKLFKNAKIASWTVLVVLCVLAIGGAILCRGLSTEYSITQFMDPKNPMLMSEFKVKDDFALPSWPYVYVTLSLNSSERGDFFDQARVSALKAATLDAQNFPGVRKAISIATAEGASLTKDGLILGRILDLTDHSKWSDRVLKDPLLAPSLISQDGRTTLVAVELEQFDTQVMNALPTQLRQVFKRSFPKSIIQIGGIPAIQIEMGDLLKRELTHFLILALLACLITLAAFFRDKASIFIPILLVGFANIGALAWMAVAKIPFTVLSTTLPVLVSIIVLSIATHTMINFASDWEQAERAQKSTAKFLIVFKTIKALFLPNFLTALTTSLGFAALLTAKVPLIKDYAECVAVGVMVAWACVMLALPPILILIPVPRPRSWTASKARWALSIEKHKRTIVCVVGVLALGLAWKGQGLNWSPKLFDDLPKGQEARVSSELIDHSLGAIIPLDVVIRSKEADAWNNPDRIQHLSALLKKIRKIDGVGSAIGLSDLIEAGSRAQNESLPKTRAGVAEMIFLYTLSPERVVNQFLTSDGMQTRLSVRVQDLEANRMRAVVEKIKSDTESEFPDLQVEAVGMASNVHEINNELCQSLIYGFWQAILLISLVLVVIFRSVKWTLVAMFPNLISPIALMGVMAIMGTPIKPGIALIFSIALGIAYNNTVYLLGRVRLLHQKAKSRTLGLAPLPILKAWYQEGNPCIFSTLALVGGFAVFMASYFELNRTFGAYMLLSILAGMLGDLIFLPALLSWFPGLLETTKSDARIIVGEGKKNAA